MKFLKEDIKNILLLIPITLTGFFSNIWSRPAELMETRNFITAREMIENNDFIIPTLNGALRFEKPPLPTWLTAFVMKITGNVTDEYILRIPAAITGILFIMLLYYFVKLMTKNSRKSFITAFVGATTFMILKLGNENAWDIYAYVFIFGTAVFTIKGFQTNKMRDFITGGFFLGASFLSKGPVGIYGLLIPFFIAYTVVYGFSEIKRNIKNIFIMSVTALIFSGIWVAAVYLKYPEIFVSILKKEQNTWGNKHTESFVYYLDYFVYMGVWIFFSVMTLVEKWNKNRTDNKEFSKFIFIWNILVIVFLSFIKMKKKRYGLPIYFTSIMGVGTICAYYWDKTWEEIKKSDKILLAVQGIFVITVSFAVPLVIFFKEFIYRTVQQEYIIMIFTIFIPLGYFIYISLFFSWRREKIAKKIILGSGALMLMINLTVNWYFDKNFVRDIKADKTAGNYPKMKEFQKNPPLLEIYSDDYEIEDVWRAGKKIKNYKRDAELPEKFIFWGEVPKEILTKYKTVKEERYIKDNGVIEKITYLKIVKEEKA